MKNKKIIILASALILLIILLIIFFLTKKEKQNIEDESLINESSQLQKNSYQPEFLSVEEKQKLNLSPETRVQAIKRNENGVIMVHKIIRNDQDIYYPSEK